MKKILLKCIINKNRKFKFEDLEIRNILLETSWQLGDCIINSSLLEALVKQNPNLKMDIEEAEIDALVGARRVIENNNLKLVLCCYHRQDDEKNIKELLKDFKVEITNGYMLFWNNEGLENLKPPYFRRGIIRATRI